MGLDVSRACVGDDGTRPGFILRRDGTTQKRLEYVNAMLYVFGDRQRAVGRLWL
jgi:hypothetical protein